MVTPSQPRNRHRLGALVRHVLPSKNRTWLMPVLTLLALLALIAGAVIVSTITRRHVQLDDGTVWVTSLNHQKAARFNVKNQEADAGISSSAPRFDVVQHNSDTVLTEPNQATFIKASTVSADAKTDIKANTTAIEGGGTIAFINEKTGNVWAGSSDQLDSLTPTTDSPQMQLGSGGRIAVTHTGEVYGYRPSDGMVVVLHHPNDAKAQEMESLSDGKPQPAESFTIIGDTPVISSGNVLLFKDGRVSMKTTGSLTLQAPSTDGKQHGWVAAASAQGLAIAQLGNHNSARLFSTGGKSTAAQPVSTNDCVYAAWSQRANNYIRVCSSEGSDKDFQTLESVNTTSELVFRTNHRLVVLNDVTNGNVWNPNHDTKVIKIQWNTIQTEQNAQDQNTNDSADNHHDFSKTCSAQSGQIRAVDDHIGARAGSEQILDVLRNDEQTDCSVLNITQVSAVNGTNVTVAPIYDGRYLQLDASSASPGTATFSYDISDGRGQTSNATVTVNLTGQGNHAPLQSDTPPEISVEQGASYTANALGSFTDPDGDPLTLVAAVPENSDQVQVSTRADGQLTFNTGAQSSGRVAVEVTVSDGEATGSGLMYFSVKPANTLAAIIDPVTKTTTPETDTVIDLTPYVHGTSAQPAQLSQVDTPNGATTTTNVADMSISFRASNPGTYYVPYTITQGSIPATGLARVEVQPVTGESAKPIAANDVALLGADNTAIVEPLTNDVDPMGGILSVTSVSAAADSGIKVGLVSHKRVYITARQVPTKPTSISYTVANAAGTSTGTIVLQPPALTASSSTPKASNINTQVRTGGIVSVDVLDHVDYPDGTTVRLKNNLQYDKKTFKGLAFVSADTVRYQASQDAGVFPITYTVEDNLGNVTSATITITVHESNAESKAPPTPHNTQAQVAAGQKVRIPITLTGIDADGDDDQLLGLGNKAPSLGRITEVGSDYLVYEAYPDSSGTDTFSYAVEDWTGQRAQAQIRVGVFQGASDSGVYARDDEITLRPNTAATVPVTQNDISGDNTDLIVDKSVEAQGVEGVTVQNNMISFTTPANVTTAYVAYTVRDKAGLSDTATLSINVDPNAPIEPPTAYDYRVPSAATIDKKSVDVDVSQWIANPSGTADELTVGVHPSGADHARVKGGDHSTIITVDLTSEARAVPYTVTNTKYNITSTAFIQVPAYGVFPPTLRPKAPELKVNARETIQININDYVRVGAGKEPHIESASSVSATKASNSDLYVNDTTLKFTANGDYAGPASITFTAVDGKPGSSKTKIINSAVITLQITVIGRDVPPPTFSSPTIDVEAGAEAKTIDLTALTHSPSGLHDDEKQYTYSGGASSGPIKANLSSSGLLKISANVDAAPGTTVSIPVAIKYSKGTVNAGITVRVAVSTRSLARLSNTSLTIKAGSTESMNILANAYNPFPETPLTVVNCRTDDAAKLSVTGCGASGTIEISAASDIGASSNTVLVTVQDGTKTKEREVTGSITISVIDKPDAPLLSPIAGDPQDGAVNLNWTPGSANGSPITDYKVQWTGAGTGEKSCGAVTACQITGLSNGKTYSFTVSAKNEVGWSKSSSAVEATPDRVPSAPSNVTVQGGNKKATVTWNPPEGDFSSIDNYIVTVSGAGAPQTKETGGPSTHLSFDFNNNDISDGATITATVKAHNKVNWGPESAASSPQDIWGDPDKPNVSMANDGTTVTLTASSANNRNAGCTEIALTGALQTTVACSNGTATFTVPENALNVREYTITAVVHPTRNANAASAEVAYTPQYQVQAPSNVRTSGSGNQCIVSWSKQGYAQSFQVSADGIGSATVEDKSSHSFTMSPWATCGNASVQQIFNGASSEPATGGPSSESPYTYQVPASITAPNELQWSDNEHIVTVSGGSVNTYGKDATVQIIINDKPFTWTPGQPLDVTGLPTADSYTWSVKVTGNNGLQGLDNTATGGTIQGTRSSAASESASLKASARVTRLMANPWILGLANTPR
ncbi:fibronectin type III domain-containing protein [Bifidobacterium saguini DSM 23967]|uniref:Fibronectin type III domain-containing protein n=2 Tax=Bifidobacterium saguini TaxID=762210 RepID=A0A087DEM5_9BIFI|nr:tandem-95 repeat protein [Bifidobacterium saguini]KFI93975.1 fibronectin type III domain-containing protein [Bifidobacterium saguini DSM 23967]QTB90290.1 tandem-95 repeat protein [Bifidobacterium saguini]